MNDGEMLGKVNPPCIINTKARYATPVDVMMDIGILPKQQYENWRFGRIPYLEAVCKVNLRKLSVMMQQMRV